MHLVGMLDSPYVRRVAVSLQLMGLPFTHQSLSVFSTYEQFRQINPVVKAPTLVCEDGVTLMDSSLILDHAEHRDGVQRPLMPASGAARRRELQRIGLALAACEKAVQIVYEHGTRPPEKRHEPWVERVTEQMLAAFTLLEAELARAPLPAASATISQAGVSIAVVWFFARAQLARLLDPARFPALSAFSAQAEQLPEFRAAPHGDRTYLGKA